MPAARAATSPNTMMTPHVLNSVSAFGEWISGQAPTSHPPVIAAIDHAAIHRDAKNAHVTAAPQIGATTQLRGDDASPTGYERLTTRADATAIATSASTQGSGRVSLRRPMLNKMTVQITASK